MPENVADAAEFESPEAVEAEATPSTDELATVKKRLAGKDQALTRIQQERDALKAERDALSAWKAQQEEASLTELEKLQRRLAEVESAKAEAEARAERIRLEKSYPLAIELFGDDPLPSEERLEALEQRLASASATGDDEDSEPRIDPNRPRRPVGGSGKPISEKSEAELTADLRTMANPFYDNVFG